MNREVQTFVEGAVDDAETLALRGLWHAAHSQWKAAHEEVQDDGGTDSAWVHGLLHREEGDAFNASYWYRRAGKPVCRASIAQEREEIILALLNTRNANP